MSKPPKHPPETPPPADGHERRKSSRALTRHEIEFDAKGNPVWRVRVDSPSRRQDDDTLDLLKCLDVEGLSLTEDETPNNDDRGRGYDPYGRHKK